MGNGIMLPGALTPSFGSSLRIVSLCTTIDADGRMFMLNGIGTGTAGYGNTSWAIGQS